eukprot:8187092-Lingulodinium_polyedra.AAC.1
MAAVIHDQAQRAAGGTHDDLASALETLRRLTEVVTTAQANADQGPAQPYPPGNQQTQGGGAA